MKPRVGEAISGRYVFARSQAQLNSVSPLSIIQKAKNQARMIYAASERAGYFVTTIDVFNVVKLMPKTFCAPAAVRKSICQ